MVGYHLRSRLRLPFVWTKANMTSKKREHSTAHPLDDASHEHLVNAPSQGLLVNIPSQELWPWPTTFQYSTNWEQDGWRVWWLVLGSDNNGLSIWIQWSAPGGCMLCLSLLTPLDIFTFFFCCSLSSISTGTSLLRACKLIFEGRGCILGAISRAKEPFQFQNCMFSDISKQGQARSHYIRSLISTRLER